LIESRGEKEGAMSMCWDDMSVTKVGGVSGQLDYIYIIASSPASCLLCTTTIHGFQPILLGGIIS